LHFLDPDELVPREGKDEEYDEIMSEIRNLEEILEGELKKLVKQLG
jgi:DNA mismatch repair protein MSH6